MTQADLISRRHLLKVGLLAPFAATGLLDAGAVFAQTRAGVRPFTYRVPQAALDDLQQRLARTRWPEREPVTDWSQGVPLTKLRELVDYWRGEYDWRRCERALARIPQFETEVDGLNLHLIHARSRHSDALPLVMTHGWPGSIVEFMEIVAPLTDPTAHGGTAEDAFHFVAPSLPGFGFSGKPTERGWTVERVALTWATLMARLGYRRYVAQGGDWGTFVTTRMAQLRVPGLAAVHLTMPQVVPNEIPTDLTPAQQRAVDALTRFETDGFGYFAIQATKPQTIGYPLADSPAGLAAWIYEKYHAWTDHAGDPEQALTRDQMLDNITLYWLTNTAASSARMYVENPDLGTAKNAGIIEMPVGCSIFPREIFPAPRDWANKMYPNLFYWNDVARGGHFAAFEEPGLFVDELRAFKRAMRVL
jgi:pimeloyl-ACP methyl ester carboxylesterase